MGCDLTPAQRLVLLALETFADYPAGTDARPGVGRLADMCNLRPRVVEYALARGRDLKLIEQTGRANPRRRLAAVYRLLPAPVSTRTGVRIEDDFNPHETRFQPAQNGVSTRTSVQPTKSLTPKKNTKRETPPPDGADATSSPVASPIEQQPRERRLEPPPWFCADHMPYGPPDKVKCGDCGTRRVGRAQWNKDHPKHDDEPAPAPIQTLNPDCRVCGGHGHVLGDDGTPIDPAMPCPICRPVASSTADAKVAGCLELAYQQQPADSTKELA